MQSRTRRGAASELLVAADLVLRGFHVFRAVGPSSPFDLVAASGDTMLRIEVRTSRERADGTLQPFVKPTDECDIYAFVAGGRIDYADAENVRSCVGRSLRPEARAYLPLKLGAA